MVRIMIKWMHADLHGMPSTGIVTVYDHSNTNFLGEWLITVEGDTIGHKPQGADRYLPPIHEILGGQVDELAKTYMAGYNHDETVHKWHAPIEPEEIENLTT